MCISSESKNPFICILQLRSVQLCSTECTVCTPKQCTAVYNSKEYIVVYNSTECVVLYNSTECVVVYNIVYICVQQSV